MYVRKRHIRRPDQFHLKETHPLYKGLVFAGLGGAPHGTTFCKDSSPQRNHSLLTGMVPSQDWVYAPELGRRALDFDGTNDFVNVPDSPTVRAVSPFTIAAWVFMAALPTSGNFYSVFSKQVGAGWLNYRLLITSSGALLFQVETGSATLVSLTSTATLGINAWYHVSASYRGVATSGRIHINAVQSSATGPNSAGTLAGGPYPMTLGKSVVSGANYYFFKGLLSDPELFGSYLPVEHISILANRADPMLDGLIVRDVNRVTFVPMGTAAAASHYYHRLLTGAAR